MDPRPGTAPPSLVRVLVLVARAVPQAILTLAGYVAVGAVVGISMALSRRERAWAMSTVVPDRDVERLVRLEQLMSDPQSENGAHPAARGVWPSVADVVGREAGGQVHHHEAQAAQVVLVDGAASSLDGAHDDRGRLSGDRFAGGLGDEE